MLETCEKFSVYEGLEKKAVRLTTIVRLFAASGILRWPQTDQMRNWRTAAIPCVATLPASLSCLIFGCNSKYRVFIFKFEFYNNLQQFCCKSLLYGFFKNLEFSFVYAGLEEKAVRLWLIIRFFASVPLFWLIFGEFQNGDLTVTGISDVILDESLDFAGFLNLNNDRLGSNVILKSYQMSLFYRQFAQCLLGTLMGL